MIWQISNLNSKLDNVDGISESVNTLSTKLETLTSTYDMSSVIDIKNDIRGINDSMDEVSSHADQIDGIGDSVNTIEDSITNVSLTRMENLLEDLGTSLTARNSVKHTMERSGVETVVSLTSVDEGRIEVSFRFSENIEARSIATMLGEDEEVDRKEAEFFGEETGVRATSPREMSFNVKTEDMDAVANWVQFIVDKIDQYYTRLTVAKEEFDSKVETVLKNHSGNQQSEQ